MRDSGEDKQYSHNGGVIHRRFFIFCGEPHPGAYLSMSVFVSHSAPDTWCARSRSMVYRCTQSRHTRAEPHPVSLVRLIKQTNKQIGNRSGADRSRSAIMIEADRAARETRDSKKSNLQTYLSLNPLFHRPRVAMATG